MTTAVPSVQHPHPSAWLYRTGSDYDASMLSWLGYLRAVEAAVGGRLSGKTEGRHGVSLDSAFEAWELGITPTDYEAGVRGPAYDPDLALA